jgi:hypothetical protein
VFDSSRKDHHWGSAETGKGPMFLRQRVAGTNPPSLAWFPSVELRAIMNNPDQDTLIRAVEDARRILGEYIEPGQRRYPNGGTSPGGTGCPLE